MWGLELDAVELDQQGVLRVRYTVAGSEQRYGLVRDLCELAAAFQPNDPDSIGVSALIESDLAGGEIPDDRSATRSDGVIWHGDRHLLQRD